MAGVIISISIFSAILGSLTELVRERQYQMKDLLEISGLLNISYWLGNWIFQFIIAIFTTWVPIIGMALAVGILTLSRVIPYVAIMMAYSAAAISMGMCFGFVIFKAEYYGLPTFILGNALAVAGTQYLHY